MIVGEKAREYQQKDPANVVGRFKRKMGTAEGFKIKSLGQTRTPIDLSAEVLKELKGFVHTGQKVDAAIITIPASFDTIQCNATKQAAEQAGFKQVVLLQEPIAASLAYANKRKEKEMPEGKWLVYDFGGGTFDVALIRTEHGELKILDHEGDNFLGGVDFDSSIVEGLIIPKLEQSGTFTDLANQIKARMASTTIFGQSVSTKQRKRRLSCRVNCHRKLRSKSMTIWMSNMMSCSRLRGLISRI